MSGFSNLYPNLPGMLVEFKDGGMQLRSDPTPPNTDSMLILGTAVDGLVMEPVAVDSATAELLFGKDVQSNGVPNGSTLIPAFKQAWDTGCRDIRLMRITGSVATASVKVPDETVNKEVIVNEDVCLADGCDATTLQVAHFPIVKDSAKVNANGVLLTTGYVVNESAGTIQIASNVCNAGANISIKYDYNQVDVIPKETKTLDAALKATLTYEPMPGTVKASLAGTAISGAYVSVVGKVVTVTNVDASTPAVAGLDIDIAYSGITNTTFTSTETGSGSTPFTAKTSAVVKTLTNIPVVGTSHLYVNDAEILTAGAFSVDAATSQITLHKEFFAMGAAISISYSKKTVVNVEHALTVSSIFGGSVYNEGVVQIEDIKDTSGTVTIGKTVKITKPETKKSQVTELPLSYSSVKYPTFKLLMEAINADASNGIYKVSTDSPNSLVADLIVTKANFINGSDGITSDKEVLFKALSGVRDSEGYLTTQGAYQLLEDYQTDWVNPVGVYADDVLSSRYSNFAYELALFCAVLSYRNKTTLGGISMAPCTDTSLAGIQAYAKKLANYSNFYIMKDNAGNIMKGSEGETIDLGMYISVVGAPDPVYKDTALGMFDGDPAIGYVAMNTLLNPQSSPTNKKVGGAKNLKFRFSNAQLDAISGNRIVTFKTKTSSANTVEGVFVVDSMTAARIGSDYARITTLKVVRETCDQLRDVCDPFIGEANTTEQRNAMAAAISKRLILLKEAGTILDYSFQILSTPVDQVLGQSKIELTLVAPQELRKITTVVGLKASI